MGGTQRNSGMAPETFTDDHPPSTTPSWSQSRVNESATPPGSSIHTEHRAPTEHQQASGTGVLCGVSRVARTDTGDFVRRARITAWRYVLPEHLPLARRHPPQYTVPLVVLEGVQFRGYQTRCCAGNTGGGI